MQMGTYQENRKKRRDWEKQYQQRLEEFEEEMTDLFRVTKTSEFGNNSIYTQNYDFTLVTFRLYNKHIISYKISNINTYATITDKDIYIV